MVKKKSKWEGFFKALTTFFVAAVIIVAVSVYFVLDQKLIGFIFLGLGVLGCLSLGLFKIKLISVYPDIIFGMIDNGILIFTAVLGGIYAGVAGAIIGGAAGNTLTDGIGGLFEGHIAAHQREYKIDNRRTAMSSMLGKMIGCLLGAGIGLILVWIIGFFIK